MTFEVGQKVLMLPSANERGWAIKEVEIARAGRKYIYVMDGTREICFHRDSGIQKSDYSGRNRRLVTREEHEKSLRRAALIEQLREYDITYRGYGGFIQSTDVLERIVAILEGEA